MNGNTVRERKSAIVKFGPFHNRAQLLNERIGSIKSKVNFGLILSSMKHTVSLNEKLFVNHYAPNHIPDPKKECYIYGNHSEVNQVNLFIIFNQLRKIHIPKSNTLQDVLLTSLKC